MQDQQPLASSTAGDLKAARQLIGELYEENDDLREERDRIAASLAAAQERLADAYDEGVADLREHLWGVKMNRAAAGGRKPNPYRAALAGESAANQPQSASHDSDGNEDGADSGSAR